MRKNLAIGTVVLVILIFGATIGWALMQNWEIPVKEAVSREGITPEEEIITEEERFGLAAKILKVDTENNLLIAEGLKDQREFNIHISDTVELIEIAIPEEAFETGYFTPIKNIIELSDFQEGRIISIRTYEDPAGKIELNNIVSIFLYPK